MERATETWGGPRSLRGAAAFARAAPVYWAVVYPQICRQMALQRRRALAIPEAALRRIALTALAVKRTNIDGAAAFAAFAPAPNRAAVIRAQVAFQAAYDYLDVLTEQPHPDPIGRSRALHAALTEALQPGGEPGCDAPALPDGGYLHATLQTCRRALADLPAYTTVRPAAQRLAQRIVTYQSFNASGGPAPRAALAAWATEQTPAGTDLAWWETASSAGSSLGLFALIAMAARPDVTADQALAVEQAYFPWIGALHSLLDSLVDREEDEISGQQTLIAHYGAPSQTAAGLARLARESSHRAAQLPQPGAHAAILASMAAIYLAEAPARAPQALPARAAVLAHFGGLSVPAMLVMRARQALNTVRIVR